VPLELKLLQWISPHFGYQLLTSTYTYCIEELVGSVSWDCFILSGCKSRPGLL